MNIQVLLTMLGGGDFFWSDLFFRVVMAGCYICALHFGAKDLVLVFLNRNTLLTALYGNNH